MFDKSFYFPGSLSWLLHPILLFFFFFAYFFFGTGWYEPARLIIEGTAPDTDAVLDLQWDSGNGYNAYEQEHFSFLPFRGSLDTPLEIIVSGGSEKNALSKNSRVVLTEIRVDDKGLPLPKQSLQAVRQVRGAGWFFESEESSISLSVPGEKQIYFSLKTNDRSGIARVTINGFETVHDLYRGNWAITQAKLNYWLLDEQGEFSVWAKMPRYAVDSLRLSFPLGTSLTSLALRTKSGRVIQLPLPDEEELVTGQVRGKISIANPTHHLKRYFHKGWILYQIVFAALLSWLVFALRSFVWNQGGLKTVLFGRAFRPFWGLFFGACAVYTMYLLAFWPGLMSVDSLNIWRAAWLPDIMINDHPVLNVIWYTFLLHLWNHAAVVPLSQIILLSFLIAAFFSFCHRQGVSLFLLLPCYALLLFSIPVGCYTIALWKDIPFALLVVFWGLVPAYFFVRKRAVQKQNGTERKHSLRLTLSSGLALLLLFLALLLFRHNGIIYLAVIPLLFIIGGLVRIPKIVIIISCCAGVLILWLVVFPPKTIKSASYFQDLTQSYLQKINQESVLSRVKQGLSRYPRLLDLKKNWQESDAWHYFLGDRYAHTFLRQTGWNDSHQYASPETDALFPALRATLLKVYKKSLEYPWIYFSWNPFLLLYLFPLSMLFYRQFPLSALFSSVIMVQIIALLFLVGTVNWRYYYFVLLGGYFLLPLILLDSRFLLLKKKNGF
ncbi:Dolichyl-phosphate-mannose-protein mannosyltransferase [Candidatus Electrothrix aarhusensis]